MARRSTWRRLVAVVAGGLASLAFSLTRRRPRRLSSRRRADGVTEREPPVERRSGNVPVLPLLTIAGAWLVFVCVALAVLGVLYYRIGRPEPTPSVAGFPQPQLVADPNTQYERMVGAQKRSLASYGWLDRKAGIAHIPIARAMNEDLERADPYAPIAGGGG